MVHRTTVAPSESSVITEPSMTWQPIETAPKDGTEINGYRPDQGVFTFRWAEMSEFVDPDAIIDGNEASEFAWWWHDRWGWMEKELTPTHWMPLPAPPTGQP